MKDRVNRNKLISLELEDGSMVFKPSEIHSAAITHFQKLFTASLMSNPSRDFSSFVDKVLPYEKSAELV